MEQINISNLSVDKNDFYFALMKFFVRIRVEDNIQIEVIGENRNSIVLNFDTIEEAFIFVEEGIKKSKNIPEIRKKYRDLYGRGEVLPALKVDLQDETKVTVTEEDIYKLIINYYGKNKNYKVDATKEMSINEYTHEIDLHFYLIEHLKYDGIEKDIKTMLTEGDLKNVFSDYLEPYGRSLVDFKYIGFIRRPGYFTEEEKPIFHGIELNTREKVKTKV